jgi:hypothetical protein
MNGKRQAEWRRNQVLELSSKGHTRLTFFKKEGDKQPKEPDYDNSKDQLEEEQEEEAGEIATTTNHVF